MEWNVYTYIFVTAFLLHSTLELTLEFLQHKHLKKPRTKVPKHLEGKTDLETIKKSVAYNLEKLRFRVFLRVISILPLWLMILFGFSALDSFIAQYQLGSILSGLAFFGVIGLASAVLGLPEELYATFSIEQRYGFNRQKLSGFFVDKLKGLLVSTILGGLLLSVILWVMDSSQSNFWLFAFVAVSVIQLLLMWLYPVLIMPLFNKFEPVDKTIADDVAALAEEVGFPLKEVVSMDGSKRSSHSNAFIVGLPGTRRIVLFDTLIEKISRLELLAVLGHELGHFKLGHTRRRLIFMFVGLFALFAGFGFLAQQPDAYKGLGFDKVSYHGALVVFGLLASELLFPFSFLMRIFSRKDEFAADRFALDTVKNAHGLSGALVNLHTENLSSPGSHPWYRGYHNTHPGLKMRLKAIKEYASSKGYPLELVEVATTVPVEGDSTGD